MTQYEYLSKEAILKDIQRGLDMVDVAMLNCTNDAAFASMDGYRAAFLDFKGSIEEGWYDAKIEP